MTATTPILHHYALSPYSEKVRLALGYKNVDWQSVDMPVWIPKPDLMPLTGIDKAIIRHENARVGPIHVHFPRVGFDVLTA